MLRLIVILLNCILAGIVSFMLVKLGMPKGDEFWFGIMVIVTPIITLMYLVFFTKSESLLQIFIQRKIAEEKKKIHDIENDKT